MEGINPELMNQFNFPNIPNNYANNLNNNNHNNNHNNVNTKEFDPLLHIPPKYDIYGRQVRLI